MSRSDNWRINKSSLMPVEGAQALKALQKVAGAAGLPSSFKVKFDANKAGSYNNLDDREISIGAGRIFNEAPIPAEKFDVLVGLTLHEVGHHLIGTSNVWQQIERLYSRNTDPQMQKFVNIGEDIAIEARLARNPNLTDYGDALFNWATSMVREAKENKLMELWIEYGLLHRADKLLDLPPELDGPMAQLAAFTAWLKNEHGYAERATAYSDYWESVKDAIKNPPKLPEPEKQDSLGEHEDGTNQNEPEEQGEDGDNDSMENWGKEQTDETGSDESTDNPESAESGDSGSESGEEDAEDEKEVEGAGEEVDEGDMETPYSRKPGDSIGQELEEAIEDAMESNSEDVTDEVLDQFKGLTGHNESS